MANTNTLLMVQLSQNAEAGPAVPDADGGGKGASPGAGNQGFHTVEAGAEEASHAVSSAVPVAFFGLAFFILAFIILAIVKKHRNSYSSDNSSTKLTKLQVLSATAASVFLAVVFNSAIFSTPYFGPVDTTASKDLTIDADILGTDNIAYVKDTITVPASEYGYELYVSTDETDENRLIAVGSEGIINPISAVGTLEDNTYGFSFEDPTLSTTQFYPVQSKSGRESVLTISPEQTEAPIDIWYAVRSKESPEDTYRVNIEYEAIGRQDLALEDMTAEICASLEEGILDYEFTNSLGETQYVSKLADGNCWTKPVPESPVDPENPDEPIASSCPTNWHDANRSSNYDELEFLYPDSTNQQINSLKESGCIADFNTATVTFDSNGVDATNMPDNINIPNETIQINDNYEYVFDMPEAPESSNILNGTRQAFIGWSITPEISSRTTYHKVLYQPGEHFRGSSPNTKVYAIWQKPSIINFSSEIDGASNMPESIEAYINLSNKTITITMPDEIPMHAKYDFIKWTGCASGLPGSTNTYIVEGTGSCYDGNHIDEYGAKSFTAKARWEEKIAKALLDSSGTLTFVYDRYTLNSASSTLDIPEENQTRYAEDNDGATIIQAWRVPTGIITTVYLGWTGPYGNENISKVKFDKSFVDFQPISTNWWFYKLVLTDIVNFQYLDTSEVAQMKGMFHSTDLETLDLPDGFGQSAEDMESMFAGSKLKEVTLPEGFGINAQNLKWLFSATTPLEHINSRDKNGTTTRDSLPAGFGGEALNMYGAFNSPRLNSFTLPDGFGQKATNMYALFSSAQSITSITLPAGFGQNAENIGHIFWNTSYLEHINSRDENGIITYDSLPAGFGQNATAMDEVFHGAKVITSITLPTNFGQIATNISGMFSGAWKLERIYVQDESDLFNNATSSSDMFTGDRLLQGEDGITYSADNANDVTNAHVGYKDGVPGYFTRVCMKDNSCPAEPGQSNNSEPTQDPGTQQNSPSNQTPSPETPSPLGVTATKIDNSTAILFATAMGCLLSGTTMLILIIEKVKRDYREEEEF